MSEKRRKSEPATARQTVRFFETLVRASSDGIIITGAARDIILANEAFCSFFNRAVGEVVATNLSVWLAQLDAGAPQRWAELEKQVHLRGECRGVEFRTTAKDGPLYLEVNAFLPGQVGSEERGIIISTWRDITPLKHKGLELEKVDEDLKTEIIERKRAEEKLQKLAHDLGERVKELKCLYGISKLVEKGDTLEEICQGTVELIPPAWQYPEITCARVTMEDREFKTKNFRETAWMQTGDIVVHGRRTGAVEVGYLEEKPAGAEGPFLEEERLVIDAIAERLGRISERKRAEAQIKADLEEKDVMLKEIHHRVKNNLQLINSLLSLQSRRIKDKENIAVFEECKNRINSIALIHEKLYGAKNLAGIDFGDYIHSLTGHLTGSYPDGLAGIALKINVRDVFLKVGSAIPCALIINELVTNAIKYAFPGSGSASASGGRKQAGEIVIQFEITKKGQATLIVADNGAGLPGSFDIDEAKTLGMQIINALIRQMRGSVHIDGSKGTKFIIEFPIK